MSSSAQFTVAGADQTWTAVEFTDPWEGWAVPIVTADTLAAVCSALGLALQWDKDTAVIGDEFERVGAYPENRYVLELGRPFERVFPDDAPPHRFSMDGWYDTTDLYFCYGFDAPWNGWATPIVDRETLERVIATTEGGHTLSWNGDTALVHHVELDETTPLAPDTDGRFHLRDLGWTFDEVTERNS
ncbi:hypothetical protein [Tsukamurella pseudospumae]|uniref:Uncharacterized protein n=1 Tax=Tsukamurella pseudospumae TaxID=239498 RepID=A0A138AU37_9ACTN|nr:hypothetical protein [Tsukamurella pseudospumae]KXP13896.1 hypothetical protein AXK60_22595 [Tsukamurella pseudospumae]